MKKTRVAIIGAGFGQVVHAPVFKNLKDCEVVAIASSDRQKAEAVAKKMGIPRAYGGWAELLDHEEIDILSIATLPGLQYEIAKAALRRSVAVFCEKPLALTSDQSLELLTLALDKGIAQMVDFEFAEIPVWRECLKRIQLGGKGALSHIEVIWDVQTYANHHRTTSWKTDPAQGGGPLFAFASHTLYYLQWFAGPIVSLSCRCEPSPGDPRKVDTLVLLEARFRSGATASARINTDEAQRQEHSLSFKTAQGTLMLKNTGKDYVHGFQLFSSPSREAGFSEVLPSAGWDLDLGPESDGRILAVGSLAKRLVQWVQGQAGSRPDFTDGHQVQLLLAAALESHLKGGAWQEVAVVDSRK